MCDDVNIWKQWRSAPVDKLALQLAGRNGLDVAYVLRQVEGWQKLRTKVPAWAAVDALEYPHRLALEQCSGEAAARCKAEIIGQIINALRENETAFPGRAFRVVETFGFSKADLKRLRNVCTQANLTVRNFPASVEALRKKLKLREGGTHYIFATTMADDSHALLLCRKENFGN